jgi:hypothetical protein
MPDPNKKVPPRQHTRASQVATAGYQKGEHVVHGGVTWVFLVNNNNLTIPGEHHSWDFYG